VQRLLFSSRRERYLCAEASLASLRREEILLRRVLLPPSSFLLFSLLSLL